MPTNVTRPVWACDVCGNTHGERFDLAEACEQAPIPELLPHGTPVLGRAEDKQLALRPLHPTSTITTDVTKYQREPGHHRIYVHEAMRGKVQVSSANLWPGRPGYLQIEAERQGSIWYEAAGARPRLDLRAVARSIGLGQPGSQLDGGPIRSLKLSWHSRNLDVVAPITPEVRAVMDHFGVTLVSWQRTGVYELSGLLLAEAGSWQQANWLAETANLDDLNAEGARRKAAWFSGLPVSEPVPLPYLDSRSNKTVSKLTRAEKALVAATGVEWDPRTSATEYIKKLIRTLLKETIPMPEGLFAGPRIFAVGGVKGGVGKSFTAAALAARLATDGYKVVLLDADLNGPSQHLIWNLGPIRVTEDLLRIAPERVADNLSVFSVGQIAESGVLPARWAQGTSLEFMRFIGATLDLNGVDVMIVDLPAGSETAAEMFLTDHEVDAPAEKVVVVTTADPLALSDAEGHLRPRMHEKWRPILVENLAYATGTTADGQTVTIRVRGDGTEIPALAAKHNNRWNRVQVADSLPWAANVDDLAGSDQIGTLVSIVLETSSDG